MDEFITLGKMDSIVNILPYTRGYKIKLCIIAQNLEQIKYLYGENNLEQIMANSIKITFHNSRDTANILSKIVGDEIIEKSSEEKVVKPLILPQEIIDFDRENKELVITQESKVIKCDKLKYYMEDNFKNKLLEKVKVNKN